MAWTRHVLMKNESFWDVKLTTSGSWIWRKLLRLRDIAYPFIRVEIRDGNSVFFWFDNWLQCGRLIDVT